MKGTHLRTSTNKLMQRVNNELTDLGATIRVVSYEIDKALLNNGLQLDRAGWVSLRDRISGCQESRENIDRLFSVDADVRRATAMMVRKSGALRGAASTLDRHRDALIAQATRNIETARTNGICGYKKGNVPWNSGLTKETHPILARIADDRTGAGNPSFGKSPSKETRLRQSMSIGKKIASGEFKPNVINSLTSKSYCYMGVSYRSSWEVIFAHFHPECSYETLRVSYTEANHERTYLVDFVDHTNRIVYEIKPLSFRQRNRNMLKEAALIGWCRENGYTCTTVDDPMIADMISKLDDQHPIFDLFSIHAIRGLRRLNENDQKSRNPEARSDVQSSYT